MAVFVGRCGPGAELRVVQAFRPFCAYRGKALEEARPRHGRKHRKAVAQVVVVVLEGLQVLRRPRVEPSAVGEEPEPRAPTTAVLDS